METVNEEHQTTSHLLFDEMPTPNGFYNTNTVIVKPGDSAITALLLMSSFFTVCGSFAYGCAAGYSSPVESEIMNELGLSKAEYSLFGSMLSVGGLVGSLASGKLADLVGRRGAMALSDIFCLLGWFAIFFSQGAWSLDLGRFSIGVGVGVVSYVVPIYIAEITPKNLRGGFVLLFQFTQCCGVSAVYFAGLVITWRMLALVGVLPCLVQLFGLLLIPESPRYLAKVGRFKECYAALKRLRGDGVDVSQEVADIKEFIEAIEMVPEVNLLHLFQWKYAHALTVALGLMALAQFGGANGILFYASDIFESAGFSSSIGSIGMAIIQIPSTAIGVYLMDKAGRRTILMFSAASMCLSCILVALSFLLTENDWLDRISPLLVVFGLWGYSAVYPMGMGGTPYVIMSEIFPMNVKGAAGSAATLVSWGTSWVVSYSFNFIMDWSSSGTFFLIAGVNALSVLFTTKLVPETKGRTLEQIQESLIHNLQ